MVFLCRGIARRTGEWAYGGIVYDPWGGAYIFKWTESGQKIFTRIDKDTIAYYINATDKDGVPIFSDGVVKVKTKVGTFFSRVYEMNGCWLVKTPNGEGIPLCYIPRKDIEIVENISRTPIRF